MNVNIGFTNPIIREDRTSSKLSAVEAFDDYFFLSGKKCKVIGTMTDKDNGKDFLVKSEDVESNIPLNILKVVSYCTGIIPLIMLIGKAIARAKYNFIDQEKSENKAATCIQSHYKAHLAQQKFEELKKKKVHVLKSLKEIVDTEKNFLDDLVKHAMVLQDEEFETVLKGSTAKKELNLFIHEYVLLISKSKKLLEKLEAVVEVSENAAVKKTKSITTAEIQDAVKSVTRGPLAAQNPMGRATKEINLTPKQDTPGEKKEDPLAKKTAMRMKEEVGAMSEVIMSKEFDQYVQALIGITKFTDRFAEIVDEEKATKLASKKGLLQFSPCLITFQRMTRYPMMLGQTKDILTKMDLTKEIDLISKAREKAGYQVKEYNFEQHTKDAKALVAKYHKVHELDGHILAFGHKKRVLEVHEELQEYLRKKKVFEESPKASSLLTPAEQSLNVTLRKLVELELDIAQTRAETLLKMKKTEEVSRELSEISVKITKGALWISDPRKLHKLQSFNERLFESI